MQGNYRPRFWKVATTSLAFGLFALSGCGHGDMDMMSNHSAVFDEHASAYQATLDSHGAAVERALDLTRIAGIETDHGSRTEPHMSAMRHELGDMMGCMGPGGEQANSQQVLGDLARLQQECDSHRAAMVGATDIASARVEEARHQGQMTGMMAEMRTHAGAMMEGAGHYECAHHAQ